MKQYLAFLCGGEDFALPIHYVVEVARHQSAVRVPNADPAVVGVINLRGQIIPIVDMFVPLGLEGAASGVHRVVVFTRVASCESEHARTIGLLVDSVTDVMDIDDEQIKTAPAGDAFVAGMFYRDDIAYVVLELEYLVQQSLTTLDVAS